MNLEPLCDEASRLIGADLVHCIAISTVGFERRLKYSAIAGAGAIPALLGGMAYLLDQTLQPDRTRSQLGYDGRLLMALSATGLGLLPLEEGIKGWSVKQPLVFASAASGMCLKIKSPTHRIMQLRLQSDQPYMEFQYFDQDHNDVLRVASRIDEMAEAIQRQS